MDIGGVRAALKPGGASGQLVVELPKMVPHGDDLPFLSVVMRTQGRRPAFLAQVLADLAQQDDRDFEVCLVEHQTTPQSHSDIAELVALQPDWMKVQVLRASAPGRAHPLNVGYSAANGRYICILDDDEIVYANWVGAFRRLARKNTGCLLRIVGLLQGWTMKGTEPVQLEEPRAAFPATFSLLRHLLGNETPTFTIAYPRELFHELGLRFDEMLSTTEDWDFLLRSAGLLPVACSAEVGGVYRWWHNAESSRTLHDRDEWELNTQRIYSRLERTAVIMPAGQVGELLAGHEPAAETVRRLESLQLIYNQLLDKLLVKEQEIATMVARQQLVERLTSRAWRWTALLRLPGRISGRFHPISIPQAQAMSREVALQTAAQIDASFSMEIARKFHI